MHVEPVSADQRRTFPQTVSRPRGKCEPELDRFLSLHQVKLITSLGKSAIYRRIAAGTFPKSIPLGPTKVAWSARAIAQWQQDRKDEAETPTSIGANNEGGETLAA